MNTQDHPYSGSLADAIKAGDKTGALKSLV